MLEVELIESAYRLVTDVIEVRETDKVHVLEKHFNQDDKEYP